MKKIFLLLLIVCLCFPTSVFAEEKENSWRYKDGVNITKEENKISTKGSSNAYKKVSGTWRNSAGSSIPNAISKGIDISHHDGVVDWSTLKNKSDVEYVIIRCGYGQDGVDRQWTNNIKGAVKYNMPFGIYIYSYATNVSKAKGEANHVINKIKSYKNDDSFCYPVYYDLEDSPTFGKQSAATRISMAKNFCTMIDNAGYDVGIYANTNWFTNYLPSSTFDQWHRWCAEYSTKCNYKRRYDIWQASSSPYVSGINHRVDVNFTLKSFLGTPAITSIKADGNTKANITFDKYSVSNPTTLDKEFIPTTKTQIQYADNSSFNNASTVTVNPNNKKTISYSISSTNFTGKTYYFRVRNQFVTNKGTYYGAYSGTKSISFPKQEVNTSDVSNITPVITSLQAINNGIKVNWNKFSNESEKQFGAGANSIIEYSTNSNFSTKSSKTINASNTSNTNGSHQISNLTYLNNKSTTYYFRIKCNKTKNGKTYTSKYSAVKSATITYPVATPSISSLKSSKAKQITINWKKGSSSKANTLIEYSTNKNFKSATKKTISSTGKANGSHTFKKLTSKKTYYFRIRLQQKISGTTYTTVYSPVKSVKCK